jgi:hypothetical protein
MYNVFSDNVTQTYTEGTLTVDIPGTPNLTKIGNEHIMYNGVWLSPSQYTIIYVKLCMMRFDSVPHEWPLNPLFFYGKPYVGYDSKMSEDRILYLPTSAPSNSPTKSPTTASPTSEPTTVSPTSSPTVQPTAVPTTTNPTTASPTSQPAVPTPTNQPTVAPTSSPTTANPTNAPTKAPTATPTAPAVADPPIEETVPIAADEGEGARKRLENENIFNYQHLFETKRYENVGSVFVTWDQPILRVVPTVTYQLTLWVTKPGMNQMFNFSGASDLRVGDNFFLTGDAISVTVYDSGSLIFSQNYAVNPYNSCPVPLNPFSSVWSTSWNCFGHLGRFLLVSSLVGIIVLIVCFIILTGFLIYQCYGCYSMRFSPSIATTINIDNEPRSKAEVGNFIRDYLKQSNTLLIVALFLPLIIAGAPIAKCGDSNAPLYNIQPCQYTFTLGTNNLVCEASSCRVNFNYQATIGLIGQTICLDFRDPENEEVVLQLQVKYVALMTYFTTRRAYFTQDWVLNTASNKGCPLTSVCPLTGCPPPPTAQYPNGPNNNYYNYSKVALGVDNVTAPPVAPNLRCTASCGCAGCGCFFCNSGCLWSWYQITPFLNLPLTAYDVQEVIAQNTFPVLEGAFYRPDARCYDSLLNVSFITFNTGLATIMPSAISTGNYSNFSINVVILSGIDGDTYDFNNNKFIFDFGSNRTFYGPASPVNVPTPGLVGDVQAASPDMRNWIWDKSSVQVLDQESFSVFTAPPKGIRVLRNAPTYPTMPFSIAGLSFYNNGYGYQAVHTKSRPLTLGFNTLAPFTVSYQESTVCPVVTCGALGVGTSNSLLGATIQGNIYSTCSAGMLSVSVEGETGGNANLGTTSLFANTSLTPFIIHFNPSSEFMHFTLVFTDGNRNAKCTVFGTYPGAVQLDNGTWITSYNVTPTIDTTRIDLWWDSLSLGTKAGMIISGAVGTLFITVMIVLAVWAIVKLAPVFAGYARI